VTFLVGENGSGKSTLVEAIAMAAGLNPEGGSRFARHTTRETESQLHRALQLVRSPGASRWSYFLRAETMHGLYTYLADLPDSTRRPSPRYHEMSHGESFLEVLQRHFDTPGFYVLDEPESALSFSSCLALVGVLDDLARRGGQVLCATHSPLLTALPGATILQLDSDGCAPVAWEELELVAHWRRYLAAPQAYLRHVVEEQR
jgi:predicted ATPase